MRHHHFTLLLLTAWAFVGCQSGVTNIPVSRNSENDEAKNQDAHTNLDPTNPVFAPYDSTLIQAIYNHWGELVNAASRLSVKSRKVVVHFRLHPDGHVSGLQVVGSAGDEKAALICQKAVLESAPFTPWPPEMRQTVTNDYRDIHLTFFFN
jgi:membrane protein involved in colicin uptake